MDEPDSYLRLIVGATGRSDAPEGRSAGSLSQVDPTEISAGRLHLRPFLPRDADEVHRACQDPDIARFTRVPSPYTREHARSWVAEVSAAQWASGEAAPFAVLDATTGALLASVGFVRFLREDAVAEIGYWCAAAARGQGVTSQAVAAVCRWGFATQGLARVEWLAETTNPASRRVAEKAGFQVEGVLRHRLRTRHGQADAWIGGLLAPPSADPGLR